MKHLQKILFILILLIQSAQISAANWSDVVEEQFGEHWQELSLRWAYDGGNGWHFLPEAATWIYVLDPSQSHQNMVLVERGEFLMGAPVSMEYFTPEETPQHEVVISKDYYVQTTEVTWAQWKAVRQWGLLNGYSDISEGSAGRPEDIQSILNYPVVDISWYDIIKWLNAYSEKDGLDPCYYVDGFVYRSGKADPVWDDQKTGYRLPTEAEWEFACRGFTATDDYNGSMSQPGCAPLDPVLDLIGWYCGNSGDLSKPVAQKYPNGNGLYDMIGNVWEWCWDWGISQYPADSVVDPYGPQEGVVRMARGGSWGDIAASCRATFRTGLRPDYDQILFGFRPVRTKPD